MALLLVIIICGLFTGWGLVVAKSLDQKRRDHQRSTYRIDFPADLDPERVIAWIRSISGTMRVNGLQRMFGATPTLSLELWGTSQGIVHFLHVPWQYEPYIRPKLETLVPGVRLTKVPPLERVWIYAVEAGLRHKERTIRVYDAADVATSILTSFSALKNDETLMMQWVISPAVPEHKPQYKTESASIGWTQLLTGSMATRDEIHERREKLDEPGMRAVLRVGAVADTKVRAQYLVRALMATLDSTRGPSTRFYKRLMTHAELQGRIERGTSPTLTYPILLSAPELAAVIGWPLNNPMVAGLPAPISRYLHTNESVPRAGRVIGVSNAPGNERPIAMPFSEVTKHVWCAGGTGSGKSTLLANMFKQDVEHGCGVILIETKGDLYNAALDYIPPNRKDNVIILNVQDVMRPVGFNILRQGDPRVVVDELSIIFNKLFPDRPSLWLQETMYYGLQTLAASKDGTLIDLPALVAPDENEVSWSDALQRAVTDPQIRSFWSRFEAGGKLKQDQRMEPLMTRMFTLMRANLINIFGQSESSFDLVDVIRGNKILLVNLAGTEQVAATLTATILTNAVWNAAKANRGPQPNLLYLDELQTIASLPIDTEEMLAKARSFNLGMVLANQGAYQLPSEVFSAITTNAKTKILFQTGDAADARKFADNFGPTVTKDDFTNLRRFEAVARISTEIGVSQPLTLQTLPPAQGYGLASEIREMSRQRYGRDVHAVQDAMLRRRGGETQTRRKRPTLPEPDLGWG